MCQGSWRTEYRAGSGVQGSEASRQAKTGVEDNDVQLEFFSKELNTVDST